MQVNISSQHFSMGESLQNYINEKLTTHVSKYFDHTIRCEVHFDKINHLFLCDIVAHTGVKTTIVSDGSASDVYASFDICLAKLDKQLNKYKSKLKDYHQKMKMSQSIESTKYIIKADEDEEYSEESNEESNGVTYPLVVAEKPIQIMELSIQDALIRIDLENLPALIFTNIDSKRLNVVYYRKDGNISWIDSK
jgi:ribosomal subunit interface protein